MVDRVSAASARESSADRALDAIVRESEVSPEVVKSLYAEQVAKLHSRATVHQYVGVIAAKLVKQRLREINKAD